MKNLILSFTILLASCAFITSCSSDSEEIPNIQKGEWKMYEQTIKSTDTDLDDMLNYIFAGELNTNETIRAFSELNVKTTVRKKGTSGTEGLVSEVTEAYAIKGDSIYVESSVYEGTMISKYIITENILTTYRPVKSEDIKKIVPNMGIDPNSIPSGVTGVLKIKEIRESLQ